MSVVHVNGQVSGITGRPMSNTSGYMCDNALSQNSGTNPFHNYGSNDDLEFDIFENSPWNLDSNSCADRPESRNTVPSNSRPPSEVNPGSPQATYTSSTGAGASHCSPMHPYSPSSMIGGHFSNSYPFSPLQESSSLLGGVINGKETIGGSSAASAPGTPPMTTTTTTSGTSSSTAMTLANSQTTSSTITMTPTTPTIPSNMMSGDNAIGGDSGRLRNLLTKGVSASSEENQDMTSNESDMQNNRILKTLLNQQDDEEYTCDNPGKLRSSPSVQKPIAEHSKSTLGNHMLLQVI